MNPEDLMGCPDCDGAGQWMQGPKYRRCELCEGRGSVCARCEGKGGGTLSFGNNVNGSPCGDMDWDCDACDGVGRDDSLPDLYASERHP